MPKFLSVAVAACTLATGLMASNFTSLVLPLGVGSSPAWAEGTPVRVRGTVVSLDGSKLSCMPRTGRMST
jgi:hypothetical protein